MQIRRIRTGDRGFLLLYDAMAVVWGSRGASTVRGSCKQGEREDRDENNKV